MPTTLNVILFVSLGWLCHKMLLFIFELFNTNTGWPTKMSIFFFGINFDKNKDTFKIFSAVTFFLHEVFKCSVREMRWCLISRTEHSPHFSNRTLGHNFPWDRLISRQTDNPWPSYSQDLNPPIF